MSYKPFSFYNTEPLKSKEYIPDSVYTVCGDDNSCTVCSNEIYTNILGGYVHDTQRAKVFCPFGKGQTLNQNIYSDQFSIYKANGPFNTTWGRAPQLEPRPLAMIGLEWRTS